MKKCLLIMAILPRVAFGGGPKYTYPTPRGLNDEMDNIYHSIPNRTTTPSIFIGAGAPSFTPQKIGDIFISTTTSKVYISTDALTSASWAVVN